MFPGTAQSAHLTIPQSSRVILGALATRKSYKGAQGLALLQDPQEITSTTTTTSSSSNLLILPWYFQPEHPMTSTNSPWSCEETPLYFSPVHFSLCVTSMQDSLPTIFLWILLPWRDKLYNRQHLLKGQCYTLSSLWFYILISVFWIKGRRAASLRFLAMFSA